MNLYKDMRYVVLNVLVINCIITYCVEQWIKESEIIPACLGGLFHEKLVNKRCFTFFMRSFLPPGSVIIL